jgi:hypothetical protein
MDYRLIRVPEPVIEGGPQQEYKQVALGLVLFKVPVTAIGWILAGLAVASGGSPDLMPARER